LEVSVHNWEIHPLKHYQQQQEQQQQQAGGEEDGTRC
jgi:hypothetical protein